MGASPVSPAVAHTSVRGIWERFREVGLVPDFGREGSWLLVALYRRLADEGRPIPAAEVARLAEKARMSDDAAEDFLAPLSERNETGALVGIAGLSLRPHPHRFLVHGHELTTWCALDPLFIVPMMDGPVTVTSCDPRDGAAVEVVVSPDGVRSVDPATAVVSIVVPEEVAAGSVEEIWGMFCHHVHFFVDTSSAEAYFADDTREVHLLSVEDAFALGRIVYESVHTAG